MADSALKGSRVAIYVDGAAFHRGDRQTTDCGATAEFASAHGLAPPHGGSPSLALPTSPAPTQ